MKEVTNVKINKKLVSEREGLCRGWGVGEGSCINPVMQKAKSRGQCSFQPLQNKQP